MAILALLIANENGVPIYSKNFSTREMDDTRIIGFFSALRMFSNSFFEEKSDLRSIHIGDVLFDFHSEYFEELGHLEMLLISQDIDPTTSQEITREIAEKFAIFFEEYQLQNPAEIELFKRGKIQNLHGFDIILTEIVNYGNGKNTISIDVHLNLSKTIPQLIKSMFKMKPELGSIYNNDENLLLDQILQEYLKNTLESDLKRRFRSFKK